MANIEQNKRINKLILDAGWKFDMISNLVWKGHDLAKVLYTNKTLEDTTVHDLSWALRLSPENILGETPSVAGKYVKDQPIYSDEHFKSIPGKITLSDVEIKDCAAYIGIPAFLLYEMEFKPLYCNKQFADLFTNRINSVSVGMMECKLPVDYFFENLNEEKIINKNKVKSFIDLIDNDKSLSATDLMKLARYCELQAKKRELLDSIG